jgi:hypothetical protein
MDTRQPPATRGILTTFARVLVLVAVAAMPVHAFELPWKPPGVA